jgi:hypothetical protein
LLIEFVGNVNSAFKEYVQANTILNKVVRFVNQVPHPELLKLYGETDLQLLVLAHTTIAPGNLPGKFFEYLASGNPILAIGSVDGDAAEVLKQTGAGVILERTDAQGIKKSLSGFYEKWKAKEDSTTKNISLYSRKYLTEQLIRILTEK